LQFNFLSAQVDQKRQSIMFKKYQFDKTVFLSLRIDEEDLIHTTKIVYQRYVRGEIDHKTYKQTKATLINDHMDDETEKLQSFKMPLHQKLERLSLLIIACCFYAVIAILGIGPFL